MSDYVNLVEIKGRLGITDTNDDSKLSQVITAVSRQIDEHCRRRFYVTDADETRYFTAERADLLDVGDLVSLSTLATDRTGDRTYADAWGTTDRDLTPFNAALDGKPYNYIERTPLGLYAFPLYAKGVKVIGKFGWPAVPSAVKEACLIQSERIFKRKDAPFGVMGSQEMGFVRLPALDQDVKMFLEPYVKAAG